MISGTLSLAAAVSAPLLQESESGSALHGLFGQGWWVLGSALLGFGAVVAVASGLPIVFTWAERRIAGRMQQRQGPNRVGPFGLLQAVADGIKLAFKEDIVPSRADRFLFMLAPGLVLAGAFGAFALLPLSESAILVDTELGVFLLFALLSLGVIGVIMAGWASNNKWSILGAMREAAQMVSYEVPLGLTILFAALVYGTLNLREMCLEQAGGFLNLANWGFFRVPPFGAVAFLIMYISLLANIKRAPFDLPEAESELVSGFHTEYSGMRFSFFFLEEYAAMFLVSAVAVCCFLGGWNLPFVSGDAVTGSVGAEVLAVSVMVVKSFFLVFVMIWIRWTLPRIRIDQVMNLCYKYLTPLAFVCLLAATLWPLWEGWWQ